MNVESAKLKNKKNKNGRITDNLGLFSEKIFGTTKEYSCACGRYSGIMCQGIVCENCGVKVQSSEARRTTFGKMDLGKDVYLVNPVAFKLLISNCLHDKFLKAHAYSVLIGKEWVSKDNGEISKSFMENCYTGPNAFREKIYPKIIESIRNNNDEYDYIITHTLPKINECLFTHLIPIIPPDLRPIISGAGNTSFIDEINKYYMIMRNYITHIQEAPILPYDKIAILQHQYFKVSELLLKKLSSKSGIMRKYLLAKRVDYSARAVIVPDYSLNLDQIDVSLFIIKEVFKPELLPRLAEKLNISELEALNKYEDPEYENVLFELSQIYKNRLAIINRQPTLHRPSMLSFFIRDIIKDYVIAIPPLACEPFNADFDGDQMAIYFPIGGSAYNEALNLLPYKNIFLPSNGELSFSFKEDLVLGLYKLSMSEEGRKRIYSLIPKECYEYIKEYMDKRITGKVLNSMLSILIDKMPNKVFTNMINDLAHLSHTEAKIGISLSDYASATEDGELSNPVNLMISAGARGNWTQAKQISDSRGFISDVQGRVIPSLITSSLLQGLSPNEYFTSSYGGLKGIIDSSRNTSVSGYLTRRLIYLISNIELDEYNQDCGSTNYLDIVLNEEFIKMFMYRVVKLDPNDNKEYIITKDNYKYFINKKIYLRTPLTCLCENGKICHKCYGYLFKKHNSRQIGYIAAQSIGERSSQLTLRTKHTSGATDIKLPNWIKIENGLIKTKIPTTIISNNDGNIIINNKTNEEVDLSYSSIEIICENYKEEIIKVDENDNIDLDDNEKYYDNEDDAFMPENTIEDSIKYTINDIGDIAKITILSHDVISSVSDFGKYLRKLPNYINENMSLSDILFLLIDALGITNIHSIHYELLLSMFARNMDDPNILYRNLQSKNIKWFKESEVLDHMILQSLIFEKFSQKLPKLLISDPNSLNWKSSIFMLLTSFNFGSKLIHSNPDLDKLFGSLNIPVNWRNDF